MTTISANDSDHASSELPSTPNISFPGSFFSLWTASQIRALSNDQVQQISSDEFKRLSTDALSGFTPEQIDYLNPKVFATLTPERFARLGNSQGMGALALRKLMTKKSQAQIGTPPMGAQGVTLQARVRLFSKEQANWTRIFDFGNGDSQDNIILAFDGQGQLKAQTFNGRQPGAVILSTAYVADTDWHTYTLSVTSNGAMTIYVDGNQLGAGQSSALNNTARASSFIGHSNWAADRDLNGQVEDLKVWDAALSPPEVQRALKEEGEAIVPGLPPLTVNMAGIQFIHQDNYLVLPATQMGEQGLSLQARVKLTEATPKKWARIFDLGNGEKSDNIILAFDGQGGLIAQTYNNGQAGAIISTSPLDLDAGWHTYTMTVSADGWITLFVDHQQVGQGQSAEVRDTLRTSSYVGHSNWAIDPAPSMMVERVHIWDETLHAEGLRSALGAIPNAPTLPPPAVDFANLGRLTVGGYRLPTLQLGRQGMTLSARVKVDAVAPLLARIFDLGNGPENDNIFLAFDGQGGLIAGTNSGKHYGAYVTVPSHLGMGWHTYTMTVSASGFIDIYVDGTLVGSGQSDALNDVTRDSNYVGHSNWTADKDLSGDVQNLQIWDHALTGTGLRSVLKQAHPPSTAPNPSMVPVVDLSTQVSFTPGHYLALTLPSMGAKGFTVQIKVRLDQKTPKGTRIFDFGNGPQKDNIFLAFDGAGGLIANVCYDTSWGKQIEIPSDKLHLGSEWHTYTMAVSAIGLVAIYVDGKLVGADSTNLNPFSREPIGDAIRANAYIGHSNTQGDPELSGQTKDLRIWDHMLIGDDLGEALNGIQREDVIPSEMPLVNLRTKVSTLQGNDVSLANATPFGHSGVTLMARMQINGSAPENWARIFDLGNGPESDNIILAFDGKGGLKGQIFNGASAGAWVSTGPLDLGHAWHTYAMMVSANGFIAIYVDGNQVAEGMSGLKLNHVARTKSLLGHSLWPADPALDATVDGAQVWGRMRSMTEIKTGILTETTKAVAGFDEIAQPMINFQHVVTTSKEKYLTIPVPTLGAAGITLQASVQLENSAGKWARIFDLGNGPESDNIILAFDGNGGLIGQLFNGSKPSQQVKTGNLNLDNAWHTYTMTITAEGLLTLWVDGHQVANQNTGFKLNNVTRTMAYAGHSNWQGDPPLTAQLQDIQIWDHSLTDDDLTNLLNAASNTEHSELEPKISATANYFSGSSYLLLEPLRGLTQIGKQGVTLRANINLGGASPENMARIFDLGSGDSKDNIILTFDAQGHLAGQIYNGAKAGSWVTSAQAFPLSGWHDVVMQIQTNGTITLYVDGQQVATGSSGIPLIAVDRTHNFVGHSNWLADPGIDAQIQNVQVWHSADSGLIATTGIKGSENGLIVYLPLDNDLINVGSGGGAAQFVDAQNTVSSIAVPFLHFSPEQIANLPDTVFTGLTAVQLRQLDLSQLNGQQLALVARDGSWVFNDMSTETLKSMVRKTDAVWSIGHLDAHFPADFDLDASLAQARVGPPTYDKSSDAIIYRLSMGGLIVDIRLSADKQKQIDYYALNKEGQLLDKIQLSFDSTDGIKLSKAEDLSVAHTSTVNPDTMIAPIAYQLAPPLIADGPPYVESIGTHELLPDGTTQRETVTRRRESSIEKTITDTAKDGSKEAHGELTRIDTRQITSQSKTSMGTATVGNTIDQGTVEDSVHVAADGEQIITRKQTLTSDAKRSGYEILTISANGERQYTSFVRSTTTPAEATNYKVSAQLRDIIQDNRLTSRADFSNTAIVKIIENKSSDGLVSVQKVYSSGDRLLTENIIVKNKIVAQIQHTFDAQGVLLKTVDLQEKGVDVYETTFDTQGAKIVSESHYSADGTFSGGRRSSYDVYGRQQSIVVYASSPNAPQTAFSVDAIQRKDEWIYDPVKLPNTEGNSTSSATPYGLIEYKHSDLTSGAVQIERFDGQGESSESITLANGTVATHLKHASIQNTDGTRTETWDDALTGMHQKVQMRDSKGRIQSEDAYDGNGRVISSKAYIYLNTDKNAPLASEFTLNKLTQASSVTNFEYYPESQLGTGDLLGTTVDRPWVVKNVTTISAYTSNLTDPVKGIPQSSIETTAYDGQGRITSHTIKDDRAETTITLRTSSSDEYGRLTIETTFDPATGFTTTTEHRYASTPITLLGTVGNISTSASLKNMTVGVQRTTVTVTHASGGVVRKVQTVTDDQGRFSKETVYVSDGKALSLAQQVSRQITYNGQGSVESETVFDLASNSGQTTSYTYMANPVNGAQVVATQQVKNFILKLDKKGQYTTVDQDTVTTTNDYSGLLGSGYAGPSTVTIDDPKNNLKTIRSYSASGKLLDDVTNLLLQSPGGIEHDLPIKATHYDHDANSGRLIRQQTIAQNNPESLTVYDALGRVSRSTQLNANDRKFYTTIHHYDEFGNIDKQSVFWSLTYDEGTKYDNLYSETINTYRTVIDAATATSHAVLASSKSIEYTTQTSEGELATAKTPKTTISDHDLNGQLTKLTRRDATGDQIVYMELAAEEAYTNAAQGGVWLTAKQEIVEYDQDTDTTTVKLLDGQQREVGVRVLQGYVEPTGTANITAAKASSVTVYNDAANGHGGSVKTVTDTDSQRNSVITRDEAGNIIQQQVLFPDGHTETSSFEYDGVGHVVYEAFQSQAKGVAVVTGYAKTFRFDALGNLKSDVLMAFGHPVASFAAGNQPTATKESSYDTQGRLSKTTQDGVDILRFSTDAQGNHRQTFAKDVLTGESTSYAYQDSDTRTAVISIKTSATQSITETADIQLRNGNMDDEINAMKTAGYAEGEIRNVNEKGQVIETYTLKNDGTTIDRLWTYSDSGRLISQTITDPKTYAAYLNNAQTITYDIDGGIKDIYHREYIDFVGANTPVVLKVVTFDRATGMAEKSLVNGVLQHPAPYSGPVFLAETANDRILTDLPAPENHLLPPPKERIIQTAIIPLAPRVYPTAPIAAIDFPFRLRAVGPAPDTIFSNVLLWDKWQRQVYLADEWPKIAGIQLSAAVASWYRFFGSTTNAQSIARSGTSAGLIFGLILGQMTTSILQSIFNVGRKPGAAYVPNDVPNIESVVRLGGANPPSVTFKPNADDLGMGLASYAHQPLITGLLLAASNALSVGISSYTAYQFIERYWNEFGGDNSKTPFSKSFALSQIVTSSVSAVGSLVRTIAAISVGLQKNLPVAQATLGGVDLLFIALQVVNSVLKTIDLATTGNVRDKASAKQLAVADLLQDALGLAATIAYLVYYGPLTSKTRGVAVLPIASGSRVFNAVTGGGVPGLSAILTTVASSAQIAQLKEAGFLTEAKSGSLNNELIGLTIGEVAAIALFTALAIGFAPPAGAVAAGAAGERLGISGFAQLFKVLAAVIPGLGTVVKQRLIIDAVEDEINRPGFWPALRLQQHLYRYGAMQIKVPDLDNGIKTYMVSSPGLDDSLADQAKHFTYEEIATNWTFTDAEMRIELTARNLAQTVNPDNQSNIDLYRFKSSGSVHYLGGATRATLIAGQRDNSTSEPDAALRKQSNVNYDHSIVEFLDVTIKASDVIQDSSGVALPTDFLRVVKTIKSNDYYAWQAADATGTNYTAQTVAHPPGLIKIRDDLYGFSEIIGTLEADRFDLVSSSTRSATWYIDGMGASQKRPNLSPDDPEGDVFQIHAGFSNVEIINRSDQSTFSLVADAAKNLDDAVRNFWFKLETVSSASAGTYDYKLSVVDVSTHPSAASGNNSVYTIDNKVNIQRDASAGLASSSQISIGLTGNATSPSYQLIGDISSLVNAMAAYVDTNHVMSITGDMVAKFYETTSGGVGAYWRTQT